LSDITDDRIAELERAVAADPAAEGFAALAELHRRAGRLEDAERVLLRGLAESPDAMDARAVVALVLADAGRDTGLRGHLERWAVQAVAACAPPTPSPVLLPDAESPGEGFSASEIDRAFDSAEPDADEMITPDSVAEEAALRADGPMALESPFESGGAFATRTMAEVLERQGDHEGAARIRAGLGESEPDARLDEGGSVPPSTLLVLERWLHNARRMQS
jgi:hypothetical protein